MNFTDVSSSAVVDFNRIDRYGRGKSKLINNKIHLEFHDEYEHFTTNSINNTITNNELEYIIENILMEPPSSSSSFSEHNSYKILKNLYNTYYSMICNCTNNNDNVVLSNICDNFDDCIHGGNYISSADKSLRHHHQEQQLKIELILNENRRIIDLIYECSDKCLCSTICHNRLIQYGPRNNLVIIDVSHLNKQHGLSSSVSIPKGAFVCEYIGEIITRDEAQKRHEQNKIHNRMNYIICLNEYPMEESKVNECGYVDWNSSNEKQQRLLKQIKGDDNDCTTTADNPCPDNVYSGSSSSCANSNNVGKHLQTFIDPSRKGNIGRYLNHSCDPNCEILSVRIDGPIPRLGMYIRNNLIIKAFLNFNLEN